MEKDSRSKYDRKTNILYSFLRMEENSIIKSLFLILIIVDDELLLRDVDTIEELTDILVSDEHRLVDLSGYT